MGLITFLERGRTVMKKHRIIGIAIMVFLTLAVSTVLDAASKPVTELVPKGKIKSCKELNPLGKGIGNLCISDCKKVIETNLGDSVLPVEKEMFKKSCPNDFKTAFIDMCAPKYTQSKKGMKGFTNCVKKLVKEAEDLYGKGED